MQTKSDFRFGFRVLGDCKGERRLVDAAAAFAGYAACDERAQVNREAYFSAFSFGADFASYLKSTGSTRGFDGPCFAPWVWFDIDREGNLDAAAQDARFFATAMSERYGAEDELLIFFSGAKGFHLAISTALWNPPPSNDFNQIARRFAERIATAAGASLDASVYDKVRCFRAPNSRHPKTGLHKRRLTLDELMNLSTGAILELARKPEPFEIPAPLPSRTALGAICGTLGGEADTWGGCQAAAKDWAEAEAEVRKQAEAMKQRRAGMNGSPRLNRSTLDFIREGAGEKRALALFSAAANLAEFQSVDSLAHALLTESALDSGLPPSEAKRQIECGLAHGRGNRP